MFFLLIKKFTLYTDLTVDEAVNKLAANVYTKKRALGDVGIFTGFKYYGDTYEQSFTIKRVTSNSRLPFRMIVKGSILKGSDKKTRCDVIIKPSVYGQVLLGVICLTFIGLFFAMLLGTNQSDNEKVSSIIQLLVFMGIFYALIFIYLSYETGKAKSFLRAIFTTTNNNKTADNLDGQAS